MVEDEEAEESAEAEETQNVSHIKRKRVMLIVLPLLIVIGLSATIFFVLSQQHSSPSDNYKVVQYNKDNPDSVSVFYDLPEIATTIKGKEGPHELRFKLNLELSSIEDLQMIEILAPKLNDVIISHTIELTTDEFNGSAGLYWFKEELFYRLNLAVAPVKIKNINFSSFDLQK